MTLAVITLLGLCRKSIRRHATIQNTGRLCDGGVNKVIFLSTVNPHHLGRLLKNKGNTKKKKKTAHSIIGDARR